VRIKTRQSIMLAVSGLPEDVAFPVEDVSFSTYTEVVRGAINRVMDRTAEVEDLTWVASQQLYSISLATHLPMQPGGNVSLKATGHFTLKPPADPKDFKARAAEFERFIDEIYVWRRRVNGMLEAARRVENAPDLGPLPEDR
jgi:hypothetical protein